MLVTNVGFQIMKEMNKSEHKNNYMYVWKRRIINQSHGKERRYVREATLW